MLLKATVEGRVPRKNAIKTLTVKTFNALIICFFIFLSFLISQARADFKPKDSPPSKKTAQGSRGCPVKVGDLAVFGVEGEEGLERVVVNENQPLLLYQVRSDRQEKLLVTVTEIRGKLDRSQLYKKEFIVDNGDYSVILLPKLDPSKKLLLTFVLLCQDRPQYGKVLHTWIDLVKYPTQINNFVQMRNLNDERKTKP